TTKLTLTGGAGGNGQTAGGAGAIESLTSSTPASSTVGNAYAYQTLTGGAGGGGAIGGAGGAVISKLLASATQGNLKANTYAYGGAGGAGGTPGAGGKAKGAVDASTSATVHSLVRAAAGAAGEDTNGSGIAGATAKAKGSVSGQNAYLATRATGGAGGAAYGPGFTGGTGALAVAKAKATSTTSGVASADARENGGGGGAGLAGANGGAGASILVANNASGSTAGGTLNLGETAQGGAGGSSAGGAAGAGGYGNATLTFNDNLNANSSATVGAYVDGIGGAGGNPTSGVGGAGGAGTAILTLSGAATVAAGPAAVGGAGGTGGATTGAGGAAKAVTFAYGVSVTASAAAYGGTGATLGSAKAKVKAVGASGTFSGEAIQFGAAGQLVQLNEVSVGGSTAGVSKAKALALVGGNALTFATGGAGQVWQVATPTGASVTAVLNANPNIKTAFGASPVGFAIAEVGGAATAGSTGSQTVTEHLDLTLDLTKLASKGDLIVGFFGGQAALPANVTGVAFSLKADGISEVTKSFTTAADAVAFFSDTAFDLGSLASPPLSGPTLTLVATFTVTTNAKGAGFWGQVIIGDPPAAGAFAQHMAALRAEGSGWSRLGPAPPPAPALTLARPAIA
ncbi:MAG TPA: hypothetical protein VGS12_08125, partial [Caulobacteraceae bacterium]|nr:hypothetical protein [Caulobacteraceae bacterium]